MLPEGKTADAESLDTTFEEVVAQVGAPEGRQMSFPRSQSLVAGTLYASVAASRPTCSRCHRPWRWPRNIAHVNLVDNVPERIKPTTKSTVVAHLTVIPGSSPPKPTLCEHIFRRLELLHTPDEGIFRLRRNGITDQFLYDPDSGYVKYNVSKQHGSLAFARLITLNSWYMALFKCLMVTTLSVLDHQVNLLLVVQLFFSPEDPLVVGFGDMRYPFAIGWLLMLFLTFIVAGHAAWVEWRIKVGPRVGDLIPQLGIIDSTLTFAAMTCFAFFSVEQQVKDIVIVLHPWKSIQPYAAFKSDGVRAYCVGYMDQYLFEVENLPGFYALFAQLFLRTFVFVLKTYRLFVAFSPVLVFSVVSSVGSVCFGWRSWVSLFYARRKLRVRLLEIVQEQREGSKATEHWRRQRDAAKKLLSLHFSFNARQRSAESTRTNTYSPVPTNKPECPKCGRDLVPRTDSGPATPDLVPGQQVRLSDRYRKFHDAKYGPMQPGQVGEVQEVGPWIPICGARTLVSVDDEGKRRTWWYDEGALEPVTPVSSMGRELQEPGDSQAQDGDPRTPKAVAPAVATAVEPNDDLLAEELRSLVCRLRLESPLRRRRYATELLRAAETLAQGENSNPDVLKIPSVDQPATGHGYLGEHSIEVASDGTHRNSLPGTVNEDMT